MASYLLVGLYDCPLYAKAELMIKELMDLYPKLHFEKQMKSHSQWEEFCAKMKKREGWEIRRSPVIWEILIDIEGRGSLIGDIDDFCEYVAFYFGKIGLCIPNCVLIESVALNKALFLQGFDGKELEAMLDVNVKLCNLSFINGDLGLLEPILSKISTFPSNLLFYIKIFNENYSFYELDAFVLEIINSALNSKSRIFKVKIVQGFEEAVADSDFIIFLDDFTRKGINESESETEWVNRVEEKVFEYADILLKEGSETGGNGAGAGGKDHKLIVGGNGPQTFIAELLRKMIPEEIVKSGHIVAIGQYSVSRAKAFIASKCDVSPNCISQIYAYGWPGETGVLIEISHALLRNALSIPAETLSMDEFAKNCQSLIDGSFNEEFLLEQKKLLENSGSIVQNENYICLADCVLQILQIWILSSFESENENERKIEELRLEEGEEEEEEEEEEDENSYIASARTVGSVGSKSNKSNISMPGSEFEAEADTIHKLCQTGHKIEKEDQKTHSILICAGIECSSSSNSIEILKKGTFMVQPTICCKGVWKPIENMASPGISSELGKLFTKRLKIISNSKNKSKSEDEDENLPLDLENLELQIEELEKELEEEEEGEYEEQEEEEYEENQKMSDFTSGEEE